MATSSHAFETKNHTHVRKHGNIYAFIFQRARVRIGNGKRRGAETNKNKYSKNIDAINEYNFEC
jgi:hypothetical protein